MTTDAKIREALDDLAAGPEPVDLADRALRGAAGRRRALVAGSAAGVLSVALAGVLALQVSPTGGGDPAAAPSGAGTARGDAGRAASAGERPATAPCAIPSTTDNGSYRVVARADWPAFVEAAVAALPDRDDYAMQSGWGWCTFTLPSAAAGPGHVSGGAMPNAYAVVNLGEHREAGSFTIDVYVRRAAPGSCAEAAAYAKAPLVSCDDGSPLTAVWTVEKGITTAIAAYADNAFVAITAIDAPAISPADLAAAAADPQLHALIPLAAAPGPTPWSPWATR